MSRSHLARVLFAVLILAALAAPPAWAAPRMATPGDALARLWASLTSLWAEAGCIIDPHGACSSGTTTEAGCIADPHGGCRADQGAAPEPPANIDEGCIIDPHGGCKTGS